MEMENADIKENNSLCERTCDEKNKASVLKVVPAISLDTIVIDESHEKITATKDIVQPLSPDLKDLESSVQVIEAVLDQIAPVRRDEDVNSSFTCDKITKSNADHSPLSELTTTNKVVEVTPPKTPEKNLSGLSTPTGSPVTPKEGVPSAGMEDYCSSTSSTPREGSPGSISPIPEEIGKLTSKDKLKVNLGKDLSLMMQALNSLQSPEEKIAALCKKYADLLDQQKLLQKQLKISQRKQAQTVKERDQIQRDNAKALAARTKLENICRELQKRNKAIKEEQNQKSLEEVTLRQEMAAEFQTTLNRIQNQMKTAVDGSSKLQSENERIGGKLNEIVEKYQAREAALESLVKQHNLQEQLVTAELKKAVLEHQEEKERDAEEKQKLLEQVLERTVQYEAKVKQEKELRTQLQYYSEKFEDFQSTLGKSNEIFTSFRSEMDKMSKKLKQAEKYRAIIQKKWEDSTKALADTVEYTQQLEAKQARLEKLSRALQVERNELAQRLRQYEGNSNQSKESSSRKKGRNEQTKKESSPNSKKTASTSSSENQGVVNEKLTGVKSENSGESCGKNQSDEEKTSQETSDDHRETVESEKPERSEHPDVPSDVDATTPSMQPDLVSETGNTENDCVQSEEVSPVANEQVIDAGE